MTSPHDTYTSPLASRNASPAMLRIWSPRHKFNTWRRIWLAVAEAQQACGLPITDEQIAELRAVVERGITDEELARAAELERELRHDVMAHVHCLGEQCPKAKPIIHLGCTSQDVVCNADLGCLFESLRLTESKVVRCISALTRTATDYSNTPTLGFTHYQVAQPTTVGRRIAGWAHDLNVVFGQIDAARVHLLKLRGFRGATGTQASFLKLFGDDPMKVARFEMEATKRFMPHPLLDRTYDLTGQTYPRVVDAIVLADLASVASVLHKIATDIRLLSNRKEIDEPFGKSQIGSSAMPYKRNPMKCERICGLARFVMNLVGNAYDTAATQWLERTLDDSSNRRLSLPEAFLALDGALDLMHEVASGLVVNEAMVRKNLMDELPFLATENILMEAVKAGGDRQDLHEAIRVHAQAAGHRVKQEGLDNDLLERLKRDPMFRSKASGGALERDLNWDNLMDPMQYVGRSVEQTERFVREVVEPLRERYAEELANLGSSDRGV
ncbi:MAG: adenylosuccinate lyase [Planctomycetota bacterium]|nr:MAG: adenylosuccinate lyase [Planctomycetota bacterium]